MTAITLFLTTLCNRLCRRLGICFDLSGISLDETELQQQLECGRDSTRCIGSGDCTSAGAMTVR